MSELHLIITDVDDPSALVEFLNGNGAWARDVDSPVLAIERILQESGQNVEVNEFETDGVRNYL